MSTTTKATQKKTKPASSKTQSKNEPKAMPIAKLPPREAIDYAKLAESKREAVSEKLLKNKVYGGAEISYKVVLEPKYVSKNIYLECSAAKGPDGKDTYGFHLRDLQSMKKLNGEKFTIPEDGMARSTDKKAAFTYQSAIMKVAKAHCHGVGVPPNDVDMSKIKDTSNYAFTILTASGAPDGIPKKSAKTIIDNQQIQGYHLRNFFEHVKRLCWEHRMYTPERKKALRKDIYESMSRMAKKTPGAPPPTAEEVEIEAFTAFCNEVLITGGVRFQKKGQSTNDSDFATDIHTDGADEQEEEEHQSQFQDPNEAPEHIEQDDNDISDLVDDKTGPYLNMFIKAYVYEQNTTTDKNKNPKDTAVAKKRSGFQDVVSASLTPKTPVEYDAAIKAVEQMTLKKYSPVRFYNIGEDEPIQTDPYQPYLRGGDMIIVYISPLVYNVSTSKGIRMNFSGSRGVWIVRKNKTSAGFSAPKDEFAIQFAKESKKMEKIAAKQELEQKQQKQKKLTSDDEELEEEEEEEEEEEKGEEGQQMEEETPPPEEQTDSNFEQLQHQAERGNGVVEYVGENGEHVTQGVVSDHEHNENPPPVDDQAEVQNDEDGNESPPKKQKISKKPTKKKN